MNSADPLVLAIDAKCCPCCNKFKMPTEFGKCNQNSNGLDCYCKECKNRKGRLKYKKQNKSKEFMEQRRIKSRKFYQNHIETERERHRKYGASTEGIKVKRAATKRWTDSSHGKSMIAKRKHRYKQRQSARSAVNNAVQSEKLIKPAHCSQCFNSERIHGHHHLGYSKKHYLHVVWLCPRCHAKLRRR